MCDWLYPENDPVPTKEGTEIIAEFTVMGRRNRRVPLPMVRQYDGWYIPGLYAVVGASYPDDLIDIIAYVIYTKPTPPEKPQNCPFCRGEMRFIQGVINCWFSCETSDCDWTTPSRKTKQEAIKVLNSIEVKS